MRNAENPGREVRGGYALLDSLFSLAKIAFVLLLIKWAWFDVFTIPTDSMWPTLHGDPRFFVGDRVAVNKHVYGLRYPLNGARLPFRNGSLDYAAGRLTQGAGPKRWDIVVFRKPDGRFVRPGEEGRILIKRVAALPGERVVIRGGQLEINGELVEPPPGLRDRLYYTTPADPRQLRRGMLQLAFQPALPPRMPGKLKSVQALRQALSILRERFDGRKLTRVTDAEIREALPDADGVALDAFATFIEQSPLLAIQFDQKVPAIAAEARLYQYGIAPGDKLALDARREPESYLTVPPGHYFLLGDNSRNSADSRVFGWVPRENLLGKAFCVWWPPGHMKDFTGWTRTWWGLLLLIGLPLGVLCYDVCVHYVLGAVRVTGPGSDGVRRGDGLIVDRRAYGLRLPWVRRPVTHGKEPQRGSLVLFQPDGPRRAEQRVGRVAAQPGDAVTWSGGDAGVDGLQAEAPADWPAAAAQVPGGYVLVNDIEQGAGRAVWLERERLRGRVLGRYWPPGRLAGRENLRKQTR